MFGLNLALILICVSLSMLCLFLTFCMSYSLSASWQLPGWPQTSPSLFLSFFVLLLFFFSLFSLESSSCLFFLPTPPILPLPSYWQFSSLLDQSGALDRQGKTSTHLSMIKKCSINKCNTP